MSHNGRIITKRQVPIAKSKADINLVANSKNHNTVYTNLLYQKHFKNWKLV